MRTNKRTFAPALIVPESILAPLDLETIFDKRAPLQVDLGCGDGTFLVELAAENPETNFIGVERLPGRVRSACRKIGAHGLTNARIVPEDVLHAAQHFFAPRSVDVFHLMFPDPWPKRRHHNRRIVNESFLRAVSRALKPGGELRITTDHPDYFAAIQTLQPKRYGLVAESDNDSLGKILSTFEKHFRAQATAIHRMGLRKISGLR